MKTDQIVGGALIDFVEALILHKTEDALFYNEMLSMFARDRELDLGQAANQLAWRRAMNEPGVAPFELKLGREDLQQIRAMIRQETHDLTVYQGRFHERYTADKGVIRTEFQEGHAFTTFGVHDLIMDLIRRLGVVPERAINMIFEFELLIKRGAPAMMAITWGDNEHLGPDEPLRVIFDEYELVAKQTHRETKPVSSAFGESDDAAV